MHLICSHYSNLAGYFFCFCLFIFFRNVWLIILSRKKLEISELFHGKNTNNIRIINDINGTIEFKINNSCIINGIKGKIRALINGIMGALVL